ncbi:MAG: Na+/H+ antiporter NhaC family protein [Planctomycetota bacterium]|jgi:Na+/H+ antiporter NhaC|nr:sodium:proton antiporter [Planctomycetota bacterium]MDP6838657.1 Na+/H+ antiporter NhaC family protein [Planctomycetota bacterium]
MRPNLVRALGAALLAALACTLALIPAAETPKLAVLRAPDLLDQPLTDAAGNVLGETVIEQLVSPGRFNAGGGNAEEGNAEGINSGGGNGREIILGEISYGEGNQPDLDRDLRASLVRGLRARAAQLDPPLARITGLDAPAAGGWNLRVEYQPPADRGAPLPGQLLLRVIDAPGQGALAGAGAALPFAPPSRLSLLPPLVAIALAVLLRRPILSLGLGVLAGGFLLRRLAGSAAGAALLEAPGEVLSTFLLNELQDSERTMIIIFVIAMLSMVGIMTKSAGLRGLMDAIARRATSARHSQIATWLMGLAVFFDDYANTILVGATMRPLTDRFRVCREKLAYIVDSTAAPVAGLSIFSTWIAFEVSTFSAQLPAAGLAPTDGYAVFIDTLPYRFYCILTLALVGLVVVTGRDFGPMLKAERRARRSGELVRKGGRPLVGATATAIQPAAGISPAAHRALLPLFTFLGLTLFEILRVGGAFQMGSDFFSIEGVTQVLYDGSGSRPLMIGSSAGLAVAATLALFAGLRGEILSAAWATLRSTAIAIAILYLAWMIGGVCKALGTADFLTVLLSDNLEPLLLPTILFMLAAVVAFSTGSSWGTMSILLPLVVGLAHGLGSSTDFGGYALMVLSIGAVLEGSIFGDHCSPLSDTTVLSSIASAADHVDHVRTQIPYAIFTMATAMVCGYLPCAFLGLSPWLALPLGGAVLALGLRIFGQRADDPPLASSVEGA